MKGFSAFIKANRIFFTSAWKKHKSYYFIYVLNIIFNFLNTMIVVYLPQFFLNAILEEGNLIKGISYIIAAVLFSLFCSFWERKASIKQNLNLVDILLDLKSKIYDKISKNNLLSFEDNEYYNSIAKALAYTDTAGDSTVKMLAELITIVFSLIGISYVIVTVNPLVAIALLFAILLAHFCMRKTNKMWFDYQQNERLPRVRLHNYLANMFTNKSFVSEIQVNNGLEFIKKVLLGNSLENAKFEAKKDSERFRWNFLAIILNSSQQIISYIYFGVLLYEKVISIATYSTLFSAVQQFTSNFNQLLAMEINFSNKIEEANLYMDFLNDDTYECSGVIDINEFKEIQFADVDFSYPGQIGDAVSNISVCIKKGQKVAIVGRNGSGKTTFVSLLMGLLPPSKGHIEINGIDLSNINLSSWFEKISAVMQNPFYLPLEIRKNITFSFGYDEIKLTDALEFACISDRINALPDKWNSILTKQFFKAGVDLSGGEKQKLAIARAIYKQCDFLVFDEPSSALDPEAEYELFQNIKKFGKEKTVLYISHRLSTTVDADLIIVLDNGSIIEEGTHDELMKKNGLYSELFRKQAQYYILENEK